MTESEKDVFLEFLGKYCKLQFNNGFLVFGIVVSVLERGLLFQSKQTTSYIAFSEINQLTPRDE